MASPETGSLIDASECRIAAVADNCGGDAEAEKEFSRGVRALRDGNAAAALTLFERAFALGTKPVYSSYLGFCIAKERGQFKKGLLLCGDALEKEPGNPVHYLNLGRIHLAAGEKVEAIRVFREGLAHGPNPEITGLLDSIGTRRPPVIASLSRNNPVNKYLGILLSKLGLR